MQKHGVCQGTNVSRAACSSSLSSWVTPSGYKRVSFQTRPWDMWSWWSMGVCPSLWIPRQLTLRECFFPPWCPAPEWNTFIFQAISFSDETALLRDQPQYRLTQCHSFQCSFNCWKLEVNIYIFFLYSGWKQRDEKKNNLSSNGKVLPLPLETKTKYYFRR